MRMTVDVDDSVQMMTGTPASDYLQKKLVYIIQFKV